MYKVKRAISVVDKNVNLDNEVELMFSDGGPSKTDLQKIEPQRITDLFATSDSKLDDDMLHIVVVIPESKLSCYCMI